MLKSGIVLSALVVGAIGAVTFGVGASDAVAARGGSANGRPSAAKLKLESSGVVANAQGKIDVKFFPAVGNRTERSWLRLKLRHLSDGAAYTLWLDDPATIGDATLVLVQGLTLTTNDDGAVNYRFDTKKGDSLPFGLTLAELGGLALEIRDGTDAAVLSGIVPTLR